LPCLLLLILLVLILLGIAYRLLPFDGIGSCS
jgi:hypothetical protein